MEFYFSQWVLELASLFVGAVGILYLYLRYKMSYWKKRGVTYIEPNLILGNMKGVFTRQSFGSRFRDLYFQSKNQKYVGLYQITQPVMMIRDPDMIKLIMVKDFPHFHDHTFKIDEKVDPLAAKHLFNARGQKWRDLRVRMTPTFTSGKLKKMFYLMSASGKELSAFIEDFATKEEVFEVKDVMAKFTTDVIASCAFGIQGNSMKDPDAEFRKMGKELINPTFMNGIRFTLRVLVPTLANLLGISFVNVKNTNFFRNLVRDTMDYREKNKVLRNDFIDLLMQIKNKGYVDDDDEDKKQNGHEMLEEVKKITKHEFTHDDLTAQVVVFFIAGFETSSTTMSFALYELAVNQDIQKLLREEVDRVLEKHKDVTYEALQDMPYLDKVINETLRKYPPVPFLSRECTKKYNIPETNVTIEKGIDVIIPIYGMQYDPKYYPNPEKFDPERFNDENKKNRPAFTFLPFGEGPRICIGMRFGLMQTKVGLVNLLKNYEFRTSPRTTIPLGIDKKSFILSSEGGIWLQVVKRS